VIDPIDDESLLRAVCFAASISALLTAEALAPRRPRRAPQRAWPNVGLFVLDGIVARVAAASSLGVVAVAAGANGWGFFNRFAAPTWLALPLTVLLLDLGMYVQHRLFHRLRWLWRLHAVHHADTEFDVTTGIRFHPGEIVVSFALKALVVVAAGASAWSVVVFEMVLSSASLFTHANLRLPPAVDATLRNLIVTPEMHRTHHSIERDEYNSNFGFLLIWWDRWLGTYRARSRAAQDAMPIGLADYRGAEQQTLAALLLQPLSATNSTP
jgi:sterol desaturase/sphingolipid hydroxylase (fatty acid hydroxylase superfamily)